MTFSRKVTCPYCKASDRIPADEFNLELKCQKCGQAMYASRPTDLDSAGFQELLSGSDIPVLVDFWASWCGPCKAMAPAYEQAALAMESRVKFAKLNTDEEQQIAQSFEIRSIPTMILFSEGREIARHSGAMMAGDIQDWLEQALTGPANSDPAVI